MKMNKQVRSLSQNSSGRGKVAVERSRRGFRVTDRHLDVSGRDEPRRAVMMNPCIIKLCTEKPACGWTQLPAGSRALQAIADSPPRAMLRQTCG